MFQYGMVQWGTQSCQNLPRSFEYPQDTIRRLYYSVLRVLPELVGTFWDDWVILCTTMWWSCVEWSSRIAGVSTTKYGVDRTYHALPESRRTIHNHSRVPWWCGNELWRFWLPRKVASSFPGFSEGDLEQNLENRAHRPICIDHGLVWLLHNL